MLKRTLALAAAIALSVSALAAQAADVLKVSAIPDEAPTELQRKFAPLGRYLEKETGMKVSFVPATLLLPTIVKSRIVVPTLFATWKPIASKPLSWLGSSMAPSCRATIVVPSQSAAAPWRSAAVITRGPRRAATFSRSIPGA